MSVVKPIEFSTERNESIVNVINEIEKDIHKTKRIFQYLPFYRRRRAMSYNLHKIPKRFQSKVKSEVLKANEVKMRNKIIGRKSNKYRKHGKNLSIHRNEKSLWLETHLWHSKRFHIKDLWGWKIPMSPTTKQERSIIRQSKETCTINDQSYLSVISVKGNTNELNLMINNLCKEGTYIEQQLYCMFDIDIYYENEFIGPISVLRITDNHIWIFVHPIITDPIYDIISSFTNMDVELIFGELNVFELFGPRASKAIRNVFVPNTSDQDRLNCIYSIGGPSEVRPGFSFAYNAFDPREKPTRDIHVDTVLYPDYSPVESLLFVNRNLNIKSDSEVNKERAALLFPSANPPKGDIPILLIQRFSSGQKGFGFSWVLVLPFGIGSVAFRSFIENGVRPIGLEFLLKIRSEALKFNFPFDRPDSKYALQYIKDEINVLIEENNKKPPKMKIINYESEFPKLENPLDISKTGYIPIKIQMVRRGTPSRFSGIYIIKDEELENVLNICEIKGNHEYTGFVLSGRNSLLSGTGLGVGYIKSEVYTTLQKSQSKVENQPEKSVVFLVRSIGSQFYHPAFISPI